MKKSLFALAAIGAVAGTAQAQSSVTVYGLVDLGYVGTNTTAANPGTGATYANGTTGVTKTNASAFADGAESTSRLGFKGNEDLGGGLSAFFTYEMQITPNQGQVISSNTGTQDRQAFAGLKKAGVGQFAFGTQYTTIFDAAGATDPGMLNNMMGNVIYDKATAAAPSYGSNSQNFQFDGMGNNSSFTVRGSNMLKVQSDTFSGFQANAFYAMNNNNTNSASNANGTGYSSTVNTTIGGTTNHTAWGLGANYTWQKLLVTANYQNFTDKAAYALNSNGVYTVGTPVQNGWSGTSLTGTNAKDNQQYYAATYDFGILKAYVQYINRKTMDVNNSANYIARTGQQIGVRSFITPTIESWASVGTGKLTVATASAGTNAFVNGNSSIGSNSANFGAFQLGTNYWLSKRTNLYAIYGQERTSNQNYTLNANPTSYNSNAYALGLRHTF